MTSVRGIVLQGLSALLLIGPAAAQQSVTPLAIEDAVGLIELRGQGELGAISPDGALIAYTACDPRRLQGDSSGGGAATAGSAFRSLGCDVRVTALADGSTRTIATSRRAGHWGPAWSPDGRRLAFYSDRDGAARVWLWERATGKLLRAAATEVHTSGGFARPLWTPDGKSLVVQLLALGVSRADLAANARQPRPAPPSDAVSGSTLILYRSAPPAADSAARSRSAVGDTAAAASTAGIDGALSYQQFGVLDLAGGKVRRIGSRAAAAWARLSPDGRWLAYVTRTRDAGGKEAMALYALRVVELATGGERTVARGIRQALGDAVSWSPDSRYLAYIGIPDVADTAVHAGEGIAAPADLLMEGAAELHVVPVAGGVPRRFGGAVLSIAQAPLWNPASDALVAVGRRKLWRAELASDSLIEVATTLPVTELVPAGDARTYWSPDGGSSLYVLTTDSLTQRSGYAAVDLRTGATRDVLRGQHRLGRAYEGPLVSPRGDAVVYLRQSAGESPDLWVAGVDFTSPKRLTTLNPRLDRYAFGQAQLIEYRSTDGIPLRGALLLPAGYEPGKRYPLVVWVYASEMGSQNLNRFGLWLTSAFNLQMFATRGYAVLTPDIPVHVGTPMRDLMKSVMPAIDKVVELGIADPERLAVAGQSNGGYSTLSLLVQTHRFKAAVMNAGFGDLTGFYGAMHQMTGTPFWQSWLEDREGAMGAPPWAAPLRYVENSPVFYLDRVQTPLLIQAGGDDWAVVPYSDQVFVGLKRLQKDVTYLRYAGEGHVLLQYPNLVDYWKRVIAFFDDKLKGAPAGTAAAAQLGRH
ncbi:MAG TPA: prolyl oligopeptidase family serine peptidase [Gemmatimonadales bacterium]|nr:prolyl oligopeptidase family serine peptidase [Gemmatimonadales bacterium]